MGRAVESALQQKDVDYELIVVDDGSTHECAAIFRSFGDPRITLIQVPRECGAGYCYNLALRRSQADFFATLHADCLVLPHGFRKLLNACQASSKTDMAHCYYFEVDAEGRATRNRFRTQRMLFRQIFMTKVDYQKVLSRYGNVAHHFRFL